MAKRLTGLPGAVTVMSEQSFGCAVFGYGLVGRACLAEVVRLGLEPVIIYTHGQGGDRWQTGLQEDARRLRVPVVEDPDFRDPRTVGRLRRLRPDILLSFYFRDVLSATVLATARLGGLNLHGSPLPRYRGRAPINWMVLHGETRGAAVLHVMAERPDSGPILGTKTFAIRPRDTAFDVLLGVRDAGVTLLRRCLTARLAGGLVPRPQRGTASVFGRRTPEDGRIDWTQSAARIVNLVRAVSRPFPGAFTEVDGRKLMVWWAEPATRAPALAPGELAGDGRRLFAGTGTVPLLLADWSFADSPYGSRGLPIHLNADPALLPGRRSE